MDNERGSKGGWVWFYFIIHSVLTGRKEIDGHPEGGYKLLLGDCHGKICDSVVVLSDQAWVY